MQIQSDFPGGNITVTKREGNTVYLKPDRRDTEGHWFYWNFRVTGAEGQPLDFIFDSSEGICLSSRGPAVSYDDGETWQWLGADQTGIPDEERFNLTPKTDSFRLAFCIPYTLQNWKSFQPPPDLFQEQTLCCSRQGRDVPLLRTRDPELEHQPLIIITGRHHACESSAGYAIEGILKAWKTHLTGIARLAVVPFVDLDGVEAGDQGKNRCPHDHNRDYTENPIYPEVAAIQNLVRSESGLIIALDLHCPYARNGDSETLYLAGSADARIAAEQLQFSRCLEKHVSGLPYSTQNNIPFGTAWNTHQNYKQGMSFAAWCGQQTQCRLVTTIELPYANASGAEVTSTSLREFGSSLCQALSDYLQDPTLETQAQQTL